MHAASTWQQKMEQVQLKMEVSRLKDEVARLQKVLQLQLQATRQSVSLNAQTLNYACKSLGQPSG